MNIHWKSRLRRLRSCVRIDIKGLLTTENKTQKNAIGAVGR
jgi:hypothetical protein